MAARKPRSTQQSRSNRAALEATVVRLVDEGKLQPVERARSGTSKQPRFSGKDGNDSMTWSFLTWVRDELQVEPEWLEDSRERDRWLTSVWKKEPHLAGVLSSVTALDKNRGWSLVGGRNQVSKYTDILHSFQCAPGLVGWRPAINASSEAFNSTDMGAIIEIGRAGKNGPLRRMYNVDSTRCKLTGKMDTPLEFTPVDGKPQEWKNTDYFRIVSMPTQQESYNGLGFCALSRCIMLAQIMAAVYEHDKESLAAKAPRGLLLLQGISEEQWDGAMEIRKARDESGRVDYFNAVSVLAGSGLDQVDAKLIAVSNLPAGFDLQKFTSLLMYGYALCFGYDPSEFYPVQFGSLGRGTEMELQHEKATVKGKLDFAYGFQENLQNELPATLEYAFDERDDQGEMIKAQVQQAYAELVKTMRDTGPGDLSLMEVRQLWAEMGLIPREWTMIEEDVEVTDIEEEETRTKRIKRDALLSRTRVYRAATKFPQDPIVRYSWPANRIETLWISGEDLLRRRLHRSASVDIVDTVDKTRATLYDVQGTRITDDDVDQAIQNGKDRLGAAFAELLEGEEKRDVGMG